MKVTPVRAARELPAFTPVAGRARHDGWTAQRQVEFIEALAECACVDEACKRVGMSPSSAYALRRRLDASSFRQAWDHALDFAIRRLSDAAFSRALNGISRPVFFQGEQIGERRHYDERLTMFLLRYRDPVRYGAWLDACEAQRAPEGAALTLAKSLMRVDQDACAMEQGRPPKLRPPITAVRTVDPADLADEEEARAERADQARRDAEWEAYLDSLGPDPDTAKPDSEGDVV